jgi:hypothetical protein
MRRLGCMRAADKPPYLVLNAPQDLLQAHIPVRTTVEMQTADQTCLVDTAVAHQCSTTRVFAPPAADAVPALGASAAGAGASLAAFAFFADEAASELLRFGAMVDLCDAERG